MAVNQENGTSVYCQRTDITEKMHQPLYCAARELVRRVSKTKQILDLGCSDLVATLSLINQGFTIFGLDLDESALKEARKNSGEAYLICADINQLPLERNKKIDTIVVLDVLEHLAYEEAAAALRRLRDVNLYRPLNLIVSMPIISLTLPMAREAFMMIRSRRRPNCGLLDRTHQIFMGTDGHKHLFREAGYIVAEEYFTSFDKGINGHWETVDKTDTGLEDMNGAKRTCYEALRDVLPAIISPFNTAKRERIKQSLISIQGVYLLKYTDSCLRSHIPCGKLKYEQAST